MVLNDKRAERQRLSPSHLPCLRKTAAANRFPSTAGNSAAIGLQPTCSSRRPWSPGTPVRFPSCPRKCLALVYDHRVIDGATAVQFLVKVKQMIEGPETLLIEG